MAPTLAIGFSRGACGIGQPGRQCDLVSITPVEGSETDFEEFPKDPELENFDLDDRKFIAVAHKHPQKPPILQAVDSQWWEFRDALGENDVEVEFICEDDIRRLHGDI